MKERIIGNGIRKLRNKVIATRKIIQAANMLMKNKYGINNCGSSEKPLAFHNLNHVLAVSLAADMIYKEALKNKKISEQDIIYLKNGSALHDIEQESANNELASAEIAGAMMEYHNVFETKEIEIVKKLILGTRVYFENNKFFQAAHEGSYLEKILADADLAHLGACTNYFRLSFDRYIKERYNGSPRPKKWEIYHDEVVFLENHKYLTPEADRIFNNKAANIEFCKKQIKACHRLN